MSLNTSTAITVGYIWVVGSALIAMALPAGLTTLAVSYGGVELPRTGTPAMTFFVAQAIAAITCGLVTHTVMVPRWRLWAYRRVPNVSLLKQRAAAAHLAYSPRHFWGRFEWTSKHARDELQRLEWSGGTGGPERVTVLGTLLRSTQYGAVIGLIALLPASLILNVSDKNAVTTCVLAIGAIVCVLTTGLIYIKARRSRISAEEALKSFIPAMIRRQD